MYRQDNNKIIFYNYKINCKYNLGVETLLNWPNKKNVIPIIIEPKVIQRPKKCRLATQVQAFMTPQDSLNT